MLTYVGLSHHTAPIEVREQLAIAADDLPGVLAELGRRFGAGTIVNTCNRIEVYLPGTHERADVLEFLSQTTGADRDLADRHFAAAHHLDAVRHLYTVAAGLDSMVLGEHEVLGQVRAAFSAATAARTDDAMLSRLFHSAIRVGRRARAETAISHHAVSVSSIAVQQARALYPETEHATVLVIGAGEAGRLAAAALIDRGVGQVLVVNRTAERGQALAAELGGRALRLDQLEDAIASADVVIAAADTPEPLVTVPLVHAAMARRPGRPLLVIDIGMPRDCDPAIGELPDVTHYDLDDLQAIAAEHFAARAGEVDAVRAIVDQEADRFLTWWEQLQVAPTITALTERAERVRQAELTRTLRRLDVTSEERVHLDALTKAIVKQLLHDPISSLREFGNREVFVDTARRLFRLDVIEDEDDGNLDAATAGNFRADDPSGA
ncbi:MAG: glutamyl-tRNA reductase [Chloroflexi bacterium]|nr:MAG: glutamyl-tRNA reductase [Chloroflexota bacterium]